MEQCCLVWCLLTILCTSIVSCSFDTCDSDSCAPSWDTPLTSLPVATNVTSTVRLNDGVDMPLFGLGVHGCAPGVGGEAEKAVKWALKHGYRMIDTAYYYENEADVARAIKKSGIPRKDVFIVSKVWNDHGYSNTKRGLELTLEKLGSDYVDLFLIHSPIGGELVATYKALLRAKQQGKIRSVGVSNFGIHHLEGLKAAGLPPPSVNQIEIHVWQHKKELVDYCRANNIAVMGYRVLTYAQRLDDPEMKKMAQKYNKSVAQVLIKWSLQAGFITIPKSARENHIAENKNVFDWQLDDQDMETINNIEQWTNSYDFLATPWEG